MYIKKRQDYIYGKGDYSNTWQKNFYFRRGNKANKKQCLLCYEMLRYMEILMRKENQNNENCVFHDVKLSNQLLFNTNFQKVENDVNLDIIAVTVRVIFVVISVMLFFLYDNW